MSPGHDLGRHTELSGPLQAHTGPAPPSDLTHKPATCPSELMQGGHSECTRPPALSPPGRPHNGAEGSHLRTTGWVLW